MYKYYKMNEMKMNVLPKLINREGGLNKAWGFENFLKFIPPLY